MYNGKKIMALVPARGGSSRLPGKNIKPIGGKAMIGHCITKALSLREIDGVFVSTDSEKIAEAARDYGGEVPFLREAVLARDDSRYVLVIKDAIERLGAGGDYDYLLILQANSPLTRVEDMQAAVHRAVDEDMDVVFTVTEVSHPAGWTIRLEGGEPVFAFREDDGRELGRSQEQEVLYRSTGAAVAVKISYFMGNVDRLRLCFGVAGQRSGVVITDQISAVDIDTELDYLFAETIFEKYGDRI